MAWVTPTTVSTGDILEAATWNQAVVANGLMGQPVFTNEAARDAAIPSPTEGMVCYLTSPTTPAATGLSTIIPTGVTTIYNGSVWVCVTDVGAVSDASTNSAAFTTGWANLTFSGTAISVTLVTGTTALVSFAASVTSTGGRYCQIGVKTGTVSASNAWSAMNQSSAYMTVGRTFVMTGLTAGTNTFTLQGQANTAGDAATSASLTVKGIA